MRTPIDPIVQTSLSLEIGASCVRGGRIGPETEMGAEIRRTVTIREDLSHGDDRLSPGTFIMQPIVEA